MAHPDAETVFRVPGVSAEMAPRRPSRVIRDGGEMFSLSLPMLNAVDQWAERQRPRITRKQAIERLLRRGLQGHDG